MELTYDVKKRALTLLERGLDFEDAVHVFASTTIDIADDRRNYGETRWLTFGMLGDRLVVLVWTQRGEARHIISMRKANDRDKKRYGRELDRSG